MRVAAVKPLDALSKEERQAWKELTFVERGSRRGMGASGMMVPASTRVVPWSTILFDNLAEAARQWWWIQIAKQIAAKETP